MAGHRTRASTSLARANAIIRGLGPNVITARQMRQMIKLNKYKYISNSPAFFVHYR